MATTKTIVPAATSARTEPRPTVAANDELGIDQAAIIASFMGQTITALTSLDANQDGKITYVEILNKVQVIGLAALATFPGLNFKTAIAQFKDADHEERKELIASFAAKFELSNTEAEWLIEDWLTWLSDGFSLVARTRTILKPAIARATVKG